MTELEQFKTEIEAFIEKHQMNATEFGKKFCQSSNFVFKLRKGREPMTATRQKIIKKMAIYEAVEGHSRP